MNVLETARRIEADRQRIERIARHAIEKIGITAYRHAAAAIRLGSDPRQAAQDVLVGNAKINQSGIAPVISSMMMLAHLRGMRRSQINVQRRAKELSAATETPEQRKARREKEMLLALLLLDDDSAGTIQRRYDSIADTIARNTVRPLLLRLGLDADRAIRESVRESIRETAEEFDARGFSPRNPYAIDNVAETATAIAYEKGRFDQWRRPESKSVLWGYRYVAILDDRTTKLCWKLNNTILPMDDPFWAEFTPPNHWHCRSCIIEQFDETKLNRPAVDLPELRILRSQFRPY